LYGYAASPTLITGRVNPETDVLGGWQPTFDTGVQIADEALAAAVDIGNIVPGLINTASYASSLPLIGYAKATGKSLEEADGELLNLAVTVGPQLGTALQLLRGGPGIRNLLSGTSKGIASVTKEAKDGVKAFERAVVEGRGGRLNLLNYEVKGVGSNFGNLKYRPRNAGVAEDVVEAVVDSEAVATKKTPKWKQYEMKHGGEQTTMKTTFEGKNVTVRLDKAPTDSSIIDFKDYDWSKSAYDTAFIQKKVITDFQTQISKYKTIKPNVHLQFSKDPPSWAVNAINEAGGTYSVKP
jgi:hypothetical protein